MARSAALTLAALLVLALAAPAAEAGTFRIKVCQADTSRIGGLFSSKAFSGQFVTRGMRLRRACAPGGPGQRGVLTGNVLRRGRVPQGSKSVVQIVAPPGTTFRTFKWLGRLRRTDCRWSMSLFAVIPGRQPRVLANLPANRACPGARPQRNADAVSKLRSVEGAERIVQRIDCVGRGRRGCSANRQNFIKTLRAVVEVTDNVSPGVAITGGELVSGSWVRDVRSLDVVAQDNTGIRRLTTFVGGASVDRDVQSCNTALVTPCGSGPFSLRVDADRAPEGAVPVRAQAEDLFGNRAMSAPVTALIDHTPPPKVRVGVEGGEGWRRSNEFAVGWENLAEGRRQTAPITGATYALCRAGGGCEPNAATAGDGVSRASGIRVPGAGEWSLRLWRQDAAGNSEPDLASDPVRLRFDPEAPRIAIGTTRITDPTRVSAAVDDPLSGVAGGTIELSRLGSGSWRALPTRLERGALAARLDDSTFPAGRYVLRASASDRAGNTGLSDRRADGSLAVVDLPLRIESRLRAGFRRKRGRLAKRRRVRRGRRTTVAGRLRTPGGQAIPFSTVRVLGRSPSGLTITQGVARTDRSGRFRVRVRARTSTPLRVVYAGSAVIRPAMAELDLRVPAASTLRVSARRVLNGQRVVFSGRLAQRAALPAGKLVELQTRLSGRWQTFRTTRTGPRGGWRVPYRFRRTSGLQRYRFRARLPREAGYPFAAGATRTVTVTVRGR